MKLTVNKACSSFVKQMDFVIMQFVYYLFIKKQLFNDIFSMLNVLSISARLCRRTAKVLHTDDVYFLTLFFNLFYTYTQS